MIITIVGSTQFKDQLLSAAKDFTMQGHIVFAPCVFPHAGDEIADEQAIQIENIVRQEINMSDAVFVVNPNKYMGASTYGFIDWAVKNNKQISFMEQLDQPQEVKEEEEKSE